MSKKRLIATVGGTAACALGIGFFMQQAGNGPGHLQNLQPAPVQQAVLEPADTTEDPPLDLTDITLTSASPDAPVLELNTAGFQLTSLDDLILPEQYNDPDVPKIGCDVTATAVLQAQALVELSISAPCFGNERVTVHHNGMMFTEATGPDGNLTVLVPALSETAIFVAEFSNGKGAVAIAAVPSLNEYDRVVVQWSDDSAFQIHAREFGAGYGDVGHVWYGVGLGDQIAAQNDSGFITHLGDSTTLAPRVAEIYTFPTGQSDKSGIVALSVEAEVTADNCGRDISAQSLELRANASLRTRDLVLTMPNCSAVGDFLVLNNLVDDLKIAAR